MLCLLVRCHTAVAFTRMLRTDRPEAVEELLEKCDSVIRAESSCPLLLENHVCERDCVKMLVLERTQNSELKHAARLMRAA